MITWFAQTVPSAPNSQTVEFISWLANSSPAVIFIVVLIALSRGWLVLPRELATRDARITELTQEKNEYKTMALKAVGLGERVIDAAERNRPTP